MIDIRCVKCGRLLLRAMDVNNSQLEIKCPKCTYLNHFWHEVKKEDEIPIEMKQINVIYK